jgi:tetratricopeptide (TPR) repeat protein
VPEGLGGLAGASALVRRLKPTVNKVLSHAGLWGSVSILTVGCAGRCPALQGLHYCYIAKAGVYEQMGNYDKALENFNKALAINNNCSEAYINRALFFRRHKDYKSSQADY